MVTNRASTWKVNTSYLCILEYSLLFGFAWEGAIINLTESWAFTETDYDFVTELRIAKHV